MLPGRTYTPDDFLKIARKRFWWVVLPAAVAAAGAASVARFVMPLQYQSSAVVQVLPTQIPGNYVQSTITSTIQERLQAVVQTVLSRSELSSMIDDFGLYPELQASQPPSFVQSTLRTSIRTSQPRGDTFTISFTYDDPQTAFAVTERVAAKFISASNLERNNQVQRTSEFFEDQLNEAKRQLEQTEVELTNYRTQYASELPSQLDANLTMLRNLRSQARDTQDSLQRDFDQRAYLQRQLTDLEAQPPITASPVVAGTDPGAAPTTAAAALRVAKANLAALEARGLLPGHPDVQTAQQRVKDLTTAAEAEALALPLSVASSVGLPPAELQRQQRLDQIRQDLSQLAINISRKEADIRILEEDAAGLERRVANTTTHETKLLSLNRNYGEMTDRYNDLFNRREDARIAEELEESGENFLLLEPASMPDQPVSPNKSMITAMGVAGGLAFGVGLIALFEYRDRSFKTDSDMVQLLSLPVLAVVPFMQSDQEIKRAKRRRWLAHLTFSSTVVVCLALVAFTFLR